ncbi:hypothetical protein L218DRAFT_1059428 [Marasmius fiardii PR-910]|nr:hypothetical protein L218DRAFT_1059428 [Marasmius fiardii PR-910]
MIFVLPAIGIQAKCERQRTSDCARLLHRTLIVPLEHVHQPYLLSNTIHVFFTDSGAPLHSKDYTTLVIFHGSSFNGSGYEKLHAISHSLNLRTVILNRRDYPGSTPYKDSELEDLRKGRKVFMDRIGQQAGEFLARFIEKERIPKATEDRKARGIAIMGVVDREFISHSILEHYVKDLVLYEPPSLCFAYQPPPDVELYKPMSDPNQKLSSEELNHNFKFWVSSFYKPPRCQLCRPS